MLAGEVVDEARDYHPSFDDNSHPTKVLIRRLSRVQEYLLAEAMKRYPSLWSEEQSVPLPLPVFEDGVALDSPFFLHDVQVTRADGLTEPVILIPYDHRFDRQTLYHGWVVDQQLYLGGNAAVWARWNELVIRFAKKPPELTSAASVMVIGDLAREACMTALCSFMAGRGGSTQRPGVIPPDPRLFAALAASAEQKFIENVWLQRSAESRFIRDLSP